MKRTASYCIRIPKPREPKAPEVRNKGVLGSLASQALVQSRGADDGFVSMTDYENFVNVSNCEAASELRLCIRESILVECDHGSQKMCKRP